MHIEVLVEEPSAEEALKNLLPKILEAEPSINFVRFQGKRDMLRHLPQRLKGYAHWLQPEMDYRIVVLIDRDVEDCRSLKSQLEQMARQAGLPTKACPDPNGTFLVLNRIAAEELEAWFLGDVDALRAAFPRVSPHLAQQRTFRDPDAVRGGTWQALERLLQSNGYYPTGLNKIDLARRVSAHMSPAANRSRSFQVFRNGLLSLRPMENGT
jgi:hypothetical protein